MDAQAHNQEVLLLVDDDKFLLEMYGTKLKEAGKQVEIAFGGEEALRRLRDGLKPRAIIFDIVMPNMDGFEFLETLKKEKLGEGAALIVLSNQGEEADVKRAQDSGVDGYIVKASAIPSEVLARINEIVAKHHA